MTKTIISSFADYAYFLTDRWGEFIGRHTPNTGKGIQLRQIMLGNYTGEIHFDATKKQFVFVEGDPRRYMPDGELSFIVIRNDMLGVLIEGELDVTAGDDDSDGLTRDRNGSLVVSPARIQELANHWLAKLEPLKTTFPKTEFFVSHGEVAFDGRLQVNAFTPLIERKGRFFSPYDDEHQIGKLESSISELMFSEGNNDAYRIYRQLVMSPAGIKPLELLLQEAVGQSRAAAVLKQGDAEMIAVLVRKHGSHETCSLINQVLGTSLNIGDYVLASIKEKGMWCNDFGWVDDRDSATGYSKETTEEVSTIAVLDAEFVLYDEVAQYFAENLKAA